MKASRGRLSRVVESTVRRPKDLGRRRKASIDPLGSGFFGSFDMAGSISHLWVRITHHA